MLVTGTDKSKIARESYNFHTGIRIGRHELFFTSVAVTKVWIYKQISNISETLQDRDLVDTVYVSPFVNIFIHQVMAEKNCHHYYDWVTFRNHSSFVLFLVNLCDPECLLTIIYGTNATTIT